MKSTEPMKIVFTSFRDSMTMEGMKMSIDKHTPKLCAYPTLTYMVIPSASKSVSKDSMERICETIMDNNWTLIRDFIVEAYDTLGVRQIILCDWATAEQIATGKPCMAGTIARYIEREVKNLEFTFPVEIELRDGRSAL